MSTLGRLTEPEAVRRHHRQDGRRGAGHPAGRRARIELGAKNQDINTYLDGKPAAGIGGVPIARLECPGNGRSR